MKLWLVSVAVLFVLAEIYIALKDFILPLPIYILGGAFLAIASNYEKGIIALFRQESLTESELLAQNATLIEERKALQAEQLKLEEQTCSPKKN
ncbi:MAG: hypothetical protein AB4368_12295 [Xenococcaceae cyanobacterium]